LNKPETKISKGSGRLHELDLHFLRESPSELSSQVLYLLANPLRLCENVYAILTQFPLPDGHCLISADHFWCDLDSLKRLIKVNILSFPETIPLFWAELCELVQ
jgi:hypothetical protein